MSSQTQLPDTTVPPRDGGPGPDHVASSHSRLGAALSGLLAAAAALATGELVSGLSRRVPSLVISVAEVFVDSTPGGVVRWSIRTFGTNQKNLLVWGVTLAALVVGVLFGLSSRRRFIKGALGFTGFAMFGGWAAARGTLSADGGSWLSAIVSGVIGIGVLWSMLRTQAGLSVVPDRLGRRASPSPAESSAGALSMSLLAPTAPVALVALPTPMTIPGRPSRRGFLAVGGLAVAWSAGGIGIGRHLRAAHNVESAREGVATRLGAEAATGASTATTIPAGLASFDGLVDDLTPLVTPNADFYRIDTALIIPQVDPADWHLRIHGMVENELSLTFDDLLAFERIAEHITISCVSNEVGGDLVGNALWTGVPLKTLLERAGVAPGATQIVGRSVDGWTAGFPTEIALDGRPAMVALTMNGEPLPVRNGFPARLMVPGLYGYVSATKWLSEIELTTWEGFDGYWIPRGWSKEGPIKTQSRIDHPRTRTQLRAGMNPIAGVAWAPTRGVARVEVQVDDEPWRMARLSGAISDNTWVQWIVDWDLSPGQHRIHVRATDGSGETQTGEIRPPAPDGATGYHTIRVSVE